MCTRSKTARVPMTVAIVTNVLPRYRQGFFDRLFSRSDLHVDVYCQARLPGVNIPTIHDRYPGRARVVPALAAEGERIVWQRLPWRRLLTDYDVVFVSGNPRYLSHALAATLLLACGRNVVLWAAGHSHGANRLTERVRLTWSRLFRHLFVYTDAEVRLLQGRGFSTHDVSAMNNGLDQGAIDASAAAWDQGRLEWWRHRRGLDGSRLLLSCARLGSKNQFDLVVAALPAMLRQCPNLVWCVVGDGPERARLELLAQQQGVSDHVRFVGELYEEAALAPWFLSAEVLVHPGAIGLTLLQAFGYGLPVVTHANRERHAPEIAAFEDGRTGSTFNEGDPDDLAARVCALLADAAARAVMRSRVLEVARREYNVDVMVSRFVAMARRAAGVNDGGQESS